MKPRTKLQMRVAESAKMLSAISDNEFKEAFNRLSPHYAKRDCKGNYYCLDCGHTWKAQKAHSVVCPHCGRRLKLEESRKRNFTSSCYFQKVTTFEEFQVFRTFYLKIYMKKGERAKSFCQEVYQIWIRPEDNKKTIYGLRCATMGYYYDSWCWGDYEIRKDWGRYAISPYFVVGKPKVLKIYRRNGFKGDFHDVDPVFALQSLQNDNHFETLWKTKQFNLIRHWAKTGNSYESFWKQILIAIRHKYKISDVSLWLDLIRFLRGLGKDICNPKFVCPDNLKEAHDYWHTKYQAFEQKERIKREQEKFYNDLKAAAALENNYQKAKGKFLNLEFKDKEIIVTPLKSVEEFVTEGAIQHHCVYTNKYYQNDKSLILHALIEGKTVATIELSLDTLKIVQCRGKYNGVPPHKERIEKLIYNNIHQIAKCNAA